MKRHIQNAAVLFGLVILIGCASSGMIQHASPLAAGTLVSIDFALVETSSALGDLTAEKHLLGEQIVSGLRSRGIFDDVDNDPAAAVTNSGVKIEAVITSINKISREQRDWAGALAGRAHIVVAATVSDLGSGKVIETFEVEGESSGGSNLAGTTDEAIQRAAELVVAQVVKISRQTAPNPARPEL
jgi:hypothetical protein